MKRWMILFILLLPLVSATINGPYTEYVDYGINYDLKQSVGIDSTTNVTVQCVNSLGQNFPLTTSTNSDYTIYNCNFEYTAPSSGKGIANIDYTLKTIFDGFTNEQTDRYSLYYGYCPNVDCPSNQECIDYQCQLICGNNKIDDGENCTNCPNDVVCKSNEKCNHGVCEVYCGNKQIDPGETCISCPKDVICQSYEKCTLGICQGFCGNQKKDPGETCTSCPQDVICSSHEKCVQGVCEGYCGNGVQDSGEWCTTCPQDAGCHNGYLCSPQEESCVKLGTDENCAALNDSCGTGHCVNKMCVECRSNIDCESKKIYTGEFICSPDNKYVLEKGYELSGTCNEGKCTGEKVELTPRQSDSCNDAGCQDGTCGCSDGYKFCQAISKCKKVADLVDNAKCSCDSECQSGYCSEDQKCITALNVKLSVNKGILKVGEQTSVTLSVDNNLDKIINTNLALNIGEGFNMVAVDGGADCSTNQCKKSIIIPERSREKIIVGLEGDSATISQITGAVTYFMDDHVERTIPISNITQIIVTDCGDKQCTEGESPSNCCTDCGCSEIFLFSSSKCEQNVCVRENRTGTNILYFILFFTLLYLFYKLSHPYIMDWIKNGKKQKHPKNKCVHCGMILKINKLFCHHCGKKNHFEKEHVDVSHIFHNKKK